MSLLRFKFLDTNCKTVNGKVETCVYRETDKMTVHWTSRRYKMNAINGNLNRS